MYLKQKNQVVLFSDNIYWRNRALNSGAFAGGRKIMILICVITSLYCVLYQCFLSSTPIVPLHSRACHQSSLAPIVPSNSRPFQQSSLLLIEQSSLQAVVPASDRPFDQSSQSSFSCTPLLTLSITLLQVSLWFLGFKVLFLCVLINKLCYQMKDVR